MFKRCRRMAQHILLKKVIQEVKNALLYDK